MQKIANALVTLAKAQERNAAEQRVANMLKYAELDNKLDNKQMQKLTEMIVSDYIMTCTDEP